MQQIKTKKVGANEKCPCESGLKYKKCCAKPNLTRTVNNEKSSEKILTCIDAFDYLYDDKGYKTIDVTHLLNEMTYRKMQLENYDKKVIMLAEITTKNYPIFEERMRSDDTVSDIIVMYRGSYRLLVFDDLPDMLPSICAMIDEMNERDNNA